MGGMLIGTPLQEGLDRAEEAIAAARTGGLLAGSGTSRSSCSPTASPTASPIRWSRCGRRWRCRRARRRGWNRHQDLRGRPSRRGRRRHDAQRLATSGGTMQYIDPGGPGGARGQAARGDRRDREDRLQLVLDQHRSRARGAGQAADDRRRADRTVCSRCRATSAGRSTADGEDRDHGPAVRRRERAAASRASRSSTRARTFRRRRCCRRPNSVALYPGVEVGRLLPEEVCLAGRASGQAAHGESAGDHAGRYCAHAFWMQEAEGTVLQASRMQMIMFQHSSPQFDIAVPHSGRSSSCTRRTRWSAAAAACRAARSAWGAWAPAFPASSECPAYWHAHRSHRYRLRRHARHDGPSRRALRRLHAAPVPATHALPPQRVLRRARAARTGKTSAWRTRFERSRRTADQHAGAKRREPTRRVVCNHHGHP